ncbi:hypothetical protein BDN72DRAFT_962661 [Pluteus cervinus]|uniref:Uncharacterized protein n=1 Tax=Pluteus cervinus TaxID=181527 RepID=A0ACD3AH82_9AGAR|nr:hypothetical protein BDN72DRAFT_962661 [Pluteus cervinus]
MASAESSSLDGKAPFTFPLELEQHIFELAYECDPPIGPTLMRVSPYVSSWIGRLLYEVIIVQVSNRLEPPLSAVQKHGQNARHLLIGINVEKEQIIDYIRSCPNVVNFALWALQELNEDCVKLLMRLPLLRLSFHIRSLRYDSDADLTNKNSLDEYTLAYRRLEMLFKAFPQLTHLDIASRSPPEAYEYLHHLPNLTYISIFHNDFEGSYVQIFDKCPHLKVVIILGENSLISEADTTGIDRNDSRVLYVNVPDFVGDWELGARGKHDVWEFVESFEEKRREGDTGVGLIG